MHNIALTGYWASPLASDLISHASHNGAVAVAAYALITLALGLYGFWVAYGPNR